MDLELLEEMNQWVLLDLEHLGVMKKGRYYLYYLWVLGDRCRQLVLLDQ